MEIRWEWIVSESLKLTSFEEGYPWKDLAWEEFKEEWGYKPVALKGVFDHSEEILIERPKDGHQGA